MQHKLNLSDYIQLKNFDYIICGQVTQHFCISIYFPPVFVTQFQTGIKLHILEVLYLWDACHFELMKQRLV